MPNNLIYIACHHGLQGCGGIQNAYFSFQTHTKQLLLEIFCDTTAGIAARFQTQERTNR